MKDKKSHGYPAYDDEKYYGVEKTASSGDCTGLEPTPPISENAAESYTDLMNIPQPKGKVNNGLQSIKKTKKQ